MDASASDASRPGPRVRRLSWAATIGMAALVPLWAWVMASAHGPGYLEMNTDPQYAYLLNSLLVAEGHSPRHTDHPGTPVQVLGACVIRATHAAAGRGPMRDDVLLRPEFYLAAMRATMVGVVFLLSVWAGRLTLRGTGSLPQSAIVQSVPLFSWSAAQLLDRPIPEPLLLGLAMVLSGVALVVLGREPSRRDLRGAAVMGAVVGVATATKILFAPMALVPLGVLAGRRAKGVYIAAAIGALLISILPMITMVPRLMGWVESLAVHTGRHGRGTETVVDLAAYPGALRALIEREPMAAWLGMAGLCVVLGLAAARPRTESPDRRAWRTLGLVSAAQVFSLLLVAKHPADHYMTVSAGMGGLTLVLAVRLVGARTPLWGRTGLVAAATVCAVGLAANRFARAPQNVEPLTQLAREETAIAERAHGAGGTRVVYGVRVSTPEAALAFGNAFAGSRYFPDLERLYPDAISVDGSGFHAFGRRMGDAEIEQRLGSTPVVLLGGWQKLPPTVQETATVRSFGRERVVQVHRTAPAPSGERP